MDPNEALRLARESANEVLDADDDRQPDDPRSNAEELAEQFLALDEWLTKGGFKPSAWETTIVLNDQREFERHTKEALAVANSTPTDDICPGVEAGGECTCTDNEVFGGGTLPTD